MTLAITNIGRIISGEIAAPEVPGNTILIDDGRIARVGGEEILTGVRVDQMIDAQRLTIIPGLIDAHTHPAIGDFSPRIRALDYIYNSVRHGVTSMISAGEVHVPGRPNDRAGAKALALLAHKSFSRERPAGVKVHGGALLLEPGVTRDDIRELAEEGVWLIGEIGIGGLRDPAAVAPVVRWAREFGFKVLMHVGGTSIGGNPTVTLEDILTVAPDVINHINGGTTAVPPAEVERIVRGTTLPLEIVEAGNPKVARQVARLCLERGELHRLMIGTDTPSATGIIPTGMLRTITTLASVAGIPAPQVIAMATGNNARTFGLNTGVIAPGREADLVFLDGPIGSVGEDAMAAIEAGDIPAVTMVLIDGEIRVGEPATPPPRRRPRVRVLAGS